MDIYIYTLKYVYVYIYVDSEHRNCCHHCCKQVPSTWLFIRDLFIVYITKALLYLIMHILDEKFSDVSFNNIECMKACQFKSWHNPRCLLWWWRGFKYFQFFRL